MNTQIAVAAAPVQEPVAAQRGLADFLGEVERRFRLDPLESFWDLEDAFRRLVQGEALAAAFNHELRCLARDPNYMGNWRPNQLMLHRGRGYALSIWMLERPQRYIHSTPFYGMFAPLGTETLHYDTYRLPPGYRNAQFDPSLRLEPAGSGMTAPGGILLLQSDQFLYDFKVERPQPVAKFITAPYQTMEWLFERDSLRAWQANDSELVSTQLRVSAYILGRLADVSSLEALQSLGRHGHHAVRWAAVQNIARLSPAAAVEQLQHALDDPHPHVRRAAAGSLRRIGPTAAVTG
jgi:hypothetical protein